MNFNNHSDIASLHAFLSPSSYHWLNYDAEKLEAVYRNHRAKQEGTELHEFASIAIKKRLKLAPIKKAINLFVNDAIGFNMESEVVLFYSMNVFGTADAIKFKDNLLRVHDLKTGVSKPSFKQLDIYCALFCLEYDVDPTKIQMETRLYQFNGYTINEPDGHYIQSIMNKIIEFDVLLEQIKNTL